MGKLKTPDWILQGKEKPKTQKAEPLEKQDRPGVVGLKKNEKKLTIKICPKCKSEDVGVVLTGKEGRGTGEWECRKCKWKGRDIAEREITEDEFLKKVGE